MMENNLQEFDVSIQVLGVRFHQPIVGLSHKLLERYNTFLPQSGKLLIRAFSIDANSEGVSVFLHLKKPHHRQFLGDIEFCETQLLHWVETQPDNLRVAMMNGLNQEYRVGQLSVREFRGIKRVHRKLSQTHGLNQPPLS